MALIVQPARSGAKGVDCITVLTSTSASRLRGEGYEFAVRYLGSLTLAERDAIVGAGMGLLAVSYSRKPGWGGVLPSASLGTSDGQAAVLHAKAAGLVSGMTLFCDLEGPSPSATAEQCAEYVNAWASVVSGSGFMPGLYVGYGVPFTPAQLYELAVVRYWHSCSAVPKVATRGYCMIQSATQANVVVDGVQVDVDEIATDAKGDVPMWMVDDSQVSMAA